MKQRNVDVIVKELIDYIEENKAVDTPVIAKLLDHLKSGSYIQFILEAKTHWEAGNIITLTDELIIAISNQLVASKFKEFKQQLIYSYDDMETEIKRIQDLFRGKILDETTFFQLNEIFKTDGVTLYYSDRYSNLNKEPYELSGVVGNDPEGLFYLETEDRFINKIFMTVEDNDDNFPKKPLNIFVEVLIAKKDEFK